MKIGILRERKIPLDKRVPLSPLQIRELIKKHPSVNWVVESSPIRCFTDEEYIKEGIPVTHDVADCDILLGVKEVDINYLISGKTYLFFSHTIKKQAQNKKLLQQILAKKITLIDYETLTDPTGIRVIAFGRWAGIVGAYNALLTFGKRYNLFFLKRAHECHDMAEMYEELSKIKVPPIKIALTGGGRVARGAMEVLAQAHVHKVTPNQFLTKNYDEPVFVQLNSRDYHFRKDGKEFHRDDFYKQPEQYASDFLKYAAEADILIACAYWDPAAPHLFSRENIVNGNFKISVIADVTCDIDGSIPSTKKSSTIDLPYYDYNPTEDQIETAFTDESNITVMAIDNLPCELPRDASTSFGRQLIDNVFDELLNEKNSSMIQRATIAKDGKLTEKYAYLSDYANESSIVFS